MSTAVSPKKESLVYRVVAAKAYPHRRENIKNSESIDCAITCYAAADNYPVGTPSFYIRSLSHSGSAFLKGAGDKVLEEWLTHLGLEHPGDSAAHTVELEILDDDPQDGTNVFQVFRRVVEKEGHWPETLFDVTTPLGNKYSLPLCSKWVHKASLDTKDSFWVRLNVVSSATWKEKEKDDQV